MAESYKIGKIFGIDIELHWTFILLLVAILIFGGITAFVTLVLLFVCVLIHELSHCFVSLRNKVKVSKVILMPLGGFSVINQIGLEHKVEFNIAIAGPLMSVLLGCIFGVLVVLAPLGPVSQMLQLLFLINLLLGVFNLLPAFPMDGGRVFKSYLERKYNQYRATMLTIKIGNIVMVLALLGTLVFVLLISASIYYKEYVFMGNLIVIFFIYGGAQTEKELMEMRHYSKGMNVSEVTSKHFVLVKASDRAQEMYDAVRRTKMHLLLTKLNGGYGYVNILRKEKIRPGVSAWEVAVKIPSIDMGRNIVDAFEEMEANEVGIAAVTSRNKLVGVVTLSHLQTFLSLHVLRKMKAK